MRVKFAMIFSLILAACGTVAGGVSSVADLDLLARSIDAPRSDDGALTRDGRLLTYAAATLVVAEAASRRSLAPEDRRQLYDRLSFAAADIEKLAEADGEGYFIELDAQDPVTALADIIGDAATSRVIRIATGGASLAGGKELAQSSLTARNVVTGVRRVGEDLKAGAIERDMAIRILRDRIVIALDRLKPATA